MPKFGKTSRKNLAECDSRLRRVLEDVIEWFDCSILEGHRSKEEQNELFEKGLSKVQFPDSKHNCVPSKAVDFAPYPIDWRGEKELQEAMEKYTNARIKKAQAEIDAHGLRVNLRPEVEEQFQKILDDAYQEVIEIVENIQRWYMLVGAIRGTAHAMDINVRSGADWDGDTFTGDQSFDDIGHVELD